ncbi:MAG: site-specific DNA-methyltransferase, partial [Acidobacteriota bacterium]
LFSSGKFVVQLINSNLKHYRYDLVWEKNLAVGHLDANQRPLRSHEYILVFSKLYRGSCYNPQMITGKPHTIGVGKSPKHYGTTRGVRTPRVTDQYHPKSVLRFNNTRTGRSLHPTQKPIDLMNWLVRTYSNRGDLILDPFAGSGSTLVAAAAHGRRAIGIEQSESYCNIITSRLKQIVRSTY